MAKKFREKLRKLNPFTRPATLEELPKPLPANPDQRLVRVYVEGYEDVAFWRGIFDHFQNPYMRFEISVPNRADLPKGKKVLMGMIPRSSDELILCVDSDFDFLFADRTEQSREVNNARYMFHTYAYATENFLCYAPSLHNVCVKATKNDTRIFDFVRFMHEYSCTIYPLFLWYAYSAQLSSENVFPLIDFKSAVRIGYLDLADNGEKTLEWLRRNVAKREEMLRKRNPKMIEPMKEFEEQLRGRGLTPENAYLFMQEMEMTADHWVRFRTGKLAIAKQPMPFKTTIQQPLTDFEDHFTENKLKVDWTWNYPYSDINIVLKKGKLSLSGTPKKDNQRGTALCLRPQSSHYSCETKVIHANESLQGLTLYGDDKNLITWGVKGKQLQLKFIKENSESILYESGAVDKDIYLKIEVEQGCIFNFYKSKDGKIWNPILDTPLKGESLIRWDRVQRPGLLHCGAKEVPAEFAYFRMINLK